MSLFMQIVTIAEFYELPSKIGRQNTVIFAVAASPHLIHYQCTFLISGV